MADKCEEHTGCLARIDGLEKSDTSQWVDIKALDSRVNKILTRLNVILGGLVVGIIMLLANVLVKL